MMKAIFLLDTSSFKLIYGEEERADLAQMLDFIYPNLDVESVRKAPAHVLSEVEVIVSGWGMPTLDSEALSLFPKLKLVLYGSGSVRSIVTPEMWAAGVRIVSSWGANSVPVSEFALSQIIFSLKHGWRAMTEAKAGRGRSHLPAPPGAYGSTVGLLSLGMIGRLVMDKLRSLDIRVIAFDPFAKPAEAEKMGVEILPLSDIFRLSDVVSCHTPWLDMTEKMLRGEHFRRMKQGATFINTARGAVVDEAEMIEVLRERPDLYAVLDVTWPEPPLSDSPLYTLPNVVLTPHIAGSLGKECRRMGRYIVEELERYLQGEPFKFEVTENMSGRLA